MSHHVQDMPPSVATAISRIQAGIASVRKDGTNTHGGYKFASTDAVYAMLTHAMGEAGLTMVTLEDECALKTIETTDKFGNVRTQQWCHFRFSFVLATSEATWTDIRAARSIFLQVLGPQTFLAAQSYVEKTFLRSLFKIPTGDIDLDSLPPPPDQPDDITDDQAKVLTGLITSTKTDVNKFLLTFKAESISDFPASEYARAVAMLQRKSSNARASTLEA